MRTAIVIPARYASSRFPGKPLVPVGGKPLIRQVWEAARQSRRAERVIVATDDERIRESVASFGGEVVLTEGEFRTGTDRLAWISERIPAEAYLNLQADEFILDARILDDLITRFSESQPLAMGTLKRPPASPADIENPNVVKVVTDIKGYALYFSRSPIPFRRDPETPFGTGEVPFYTHLGIYIYRKDALQNLARLPSGILEEVEKLEQLRALENGIPIKVWETSRLTLRIDTREDAEEAERFLMKTEPGRPI